MFMSASVVRYISKHTHTV